MQKQSFREKALSAQTFTNHKVYIMKTISAANQKGGVGKSAVSCHEAFSLAEKNFSVLFIDNDPQGNSSKALLKSLLAAKAPFVTIDLYAELDLSDFKPTAQITVVTADRTLSKVARYETDAPFIFRENIQKIKGHFDFCIIDNPPTLGLGLIAALVSSDFVFSPIELEDFSIEGLKDLMQTIEGVRQRHNTELEYLGIIPNRLNSRDNRQKEKFVKLITAFPDKIIKAPIVQRGSISEALSRGLPVWALIKEKAAAKKATEEIRAALDFIENKMNITAKV